MAFKNKLFRMHFNYFNWGINMALYKCPECGKEVSNQTKSCPNCGYPLEYSCDSKVNLKKDYLLKIKK